MSRPTWDPTRAARGFGYGALTLYRRPFQAVPLPRGDPTPWSRNPREQAPWFGLLRVRSPLLAQSLCLISFPPGTEMFHFPGFRPSGLCVQPEVTGRNPRRIAPFGHPGIKMCLPLPQAYRSLPRPSSPCDAKASTVRPFALVRDLSEAFASILGRLPLRASSLGPKPSPRSHALGSIVLKSNC